MALLMDDDGLADPVNQCGMRRLRHSLAARLANS